MERTVFLLVRISVQEILKKLFHKFSGSFLCMCSFWNSGNHHGNASGGTSPYKYAYYYKKSTDSSWSKAYVTSSGSAYTKYDSIKFTPKTADTYNVKINVKDKYGEGDVVSKEFKVTAR